MLPSAGPDPPLAPARPFAELLREQDFLQAFIMRRGFDRASAEDLVQDTFLMAHRLGGYRDGIASTRTWLCAIAIRLAANARRSTGRRHLLFAADTKTQVIGESRAPDSSAPDFLFSQRLHAEKITRALEALTKNQRECLLRFYLAGETCDMIAQFEKVPIGTVYSRLHAARQKFMLAYGTLCR